MGVAVDTSDEELSTVEAAVALNVTPMTLRVWERTYGFPSSHGAAHARRRFLASEIQALCDALTTQPIRTAVQAARLSIA